MEGSPRHVHQLTKPIRCIVKLGGAAITCKNELERINEGNLQVLSSQLREAMAGDSCVSQQAVSLDWSLRPGKSEACCDVDQLEGQRLLNSAPGFVVVHGAGSFGHFQASRSGVHTGGLNQPLVKAGFVATRISVTTLNLEIVRALAQDGIPSIAMSPFSCGWSTSRKNIELADLLMVTKAIESGFVPVLHGDAVLDDKLGCTILSGDVIIRHLAAHLKPDYVVFLSIFVLLDSCVPINMHQKTDVFGVYDRPPSEPDAVLLREIAVSKDGSWSVVKPTLQNTSTRVEMTVAAHDTTGGMATKIAEAAMIAKLGIDVYIVKAATEHSFRALKGEIRDAIPDDWLCTVIRYVE